MSGLIPALPPSVTVVGILLLLAAINFRGMRESSATNIVATMVELTGLLIVIVVGALFLSETPDASISRTIAASSEVSWNGIARGAALGFFAFIGFEDMVNVAEEVKDPKRNMPRAILLALVVTGCVYLLVVLVATSVVVPTTLGCNEPPMPSPIDCSR
jgi:amino acid transporter